MPFSSLDVPIPDIADDQLCWNTLAEHAQKPDKLLQNWLQDQGSLTQQLIRLSDKQFRVEVVAENWVTHLNPQLLAHFGPLAPSHRFWSRKVLLRGKEKAWVAAHTLIPEHSFCSPLQEVMKLNTKPLGEYLFSHPELLRSEMDFTPCEQDCWGRRSLFFLFRKPVMVAEFFLPELCASIRA